MGAFEKVKGEVKEAAGRVTDNEKLEQEGKAQSERGDEEVDAAKARAEAKAHEAKAEVKEKEQEFAQRTKS